MVWQTELLEAASDMEITGEEVTGMVEGVLEAGVRGMVLVGIMSMFVKGFYGILGPKKYAKQEKEVLEMVEKIW